MSVRRVCSSSRTNADGVDRYNAIFQSVKHQPPFRKESPRPKARRSRPEGHFDPSKYSTRFIALKFAYLGQNYNGLEYHANNKTPLPTIEAELWKALNKARLVLPTPNPSLEAGEPNWAGCEYSKCGRTDKGVSAFGQVIGLQIRSNRPVLQTSATPVVANISGYRAIENNAQADGLGKSTGTPTVDNIQIDEGAFTPSSTGRSLDEEVPLFHPIKDEIPYCQVLNRLLPPDIRMLAWCPSPPHDFSARFSCKERRYKYFFTQPAFTPTFGPAGLVNNCTVPKLPEGRRREGWLDVEAMRDAARRFVGLHDFRNFCKVDESKQIQNFKRRIFYAEIEALDPQRSPVGYVGKSGFQQYANPDAIPAWKFSDDAIKVQHSTPTVYAFTLHGSAFLWHQVRHMVAMLFLVGQGLEKPSVIDDLLDVENNPCKPQYEMADDAPLVLWDCVFPEESSDDRNDALKWVYVGDYVGNEQGIVRAGGNSGGGKYGMGGVVDDMWSVWRARRMDEILAGALLDIVVKQGHTEQNAVLEGRQRNADRNGSQKVFQGDNGYRLRGRYIPVMERPKMETVEAINAKYVKKEITKRGAIQDRAGIHYLSD